MNKEVLATVKDDVPVTQWEVERKKEVSLAAVTIRDRAVTARGALEGWEEEGEEQWAEQEVCQGQKCCWAARYGWARVGLPSTNHVMCLISEG